MELFAGRRHGRILVVALVLAHIVAIGRQVEAGGGRSLMGRGLFLLLSPIQRAGAVSVSGVLNAWRSYFALRDAREESRRLSEQVRTLEVLLAEKRAVAAEAERLRGLLELRQILPLKTIVAEVTTRDATPWFRSLTIDKGSADGVHLDAPVISPSGVVGRVIAVGLSAAKVQTILDRDLAVGAMVDRSRVAGVVLNRSGLGGEGKPDLFMNYVPAAADVVVGDVLVTSGFDRIFPKGLVIGRVVAVGGGSALFREIAVAPSVRFEIVEELLVVPMAREEPRLTESIR
jgi:rod shape-determining protein MreC